MCFDNFGIGIHEDEIYIAHRIGPYKENYNRPFIVIFSRQLKTNIMKKYKVIKKVVKQLLTRILFRLINKIDVPHWKIQNQLEMLGRLKGNFIQHTNR